MGITISHYKDPYSPTSIMERRMVFFGAHMGFNLRVVTYKHGTQQKHREIMEKHQELIKFQE